MRGEQIMIGFIGGVLFGSITTLFAMCLLIAGKEEGEEE